MNLNFDNNLPIYVQLVEKIKFSIVSGELKKGERLPSVRDFALKFKVNPNTMQKALQEIEESRLIYTERTNGKFVTNDENLISALKKEYLDNIIKNFFNSMKEIGVNKQNALNYLQNFKEE